MRGTTCDFVSHGIYCTFVFYFFFPLNLSFIEALFHQAVKPSSLPDTDLYNLQIGQSWWVDPVSGFRLTHLIISMRF